MKFDMEWYVVFVAFLTSFFAVFLSNGVIVAVPTIASDFAMNNVVQNWVPTIIFLVVAVFTVPAGQLSGKFGVKKSLLAGVIVYLIGSIGCVLSFSTEVFMLFRVVSGAGMAFLTVSSMAMVVSAVKPQNRGKALGYTVTGVYIATSLSPVICGLLTFNFGWRAIFYVVIPFLILCLALIMIKIPMEWQTYAEDKIDKIGSIIWGIGILAFVYGFTNLVNSTGVFLTVFGLAVIVVFIFYELRQKSPVFNVRLFKNTKFLSSNVAALCSYLAIMVVTTILNYHFQYVRGWNTQMTGMMLIIPPILQAILAPNAGKLSDKYNPQVIAAIGIGMGVFSSPNMNAIMSSVPPKDAPTASASQATMRTIGQTMSLGMLTLVFAWIMGDLPMLAKYADLIVQGSQIICVICTVLCIIGIFSSLFGIRSKDKFNTES